MDILESMMILCEKHPGGVCSCQKNVPMKETIVSISGNQGKSVDNEIAILLERFKGQEIIEMTLAEACNLLGKTRRRSDAFKSIQKKLREDYNVELKFIKKWEQKSKE